MKWAVSQLLMVVPLVWSALVVWSIRTRFWRQSDGAREARIRADAKFWCVFVTVGSALLLPLVVPLPGISYGVEAALFATIAFPVTLYIGYWTFRAFYSILDQRK